MVIENSTGNPKLFSGRIESFCLDDNQPFLQFGIVMPAVDAVHVNHLYRWQYRRN